MARKALKPLGDCYRWAYHYVLKHPGAVLYQGKVTAPPSSGGGSAPYDHAWVLDGGVVKDWQTMVAGFGGRYRGRGWPESVWNRVWQPQDTRAYSIEQAMIQLAQHDHYGPWR